MSSIQNCSSEILVKLLQCSRRLGTELRDHAMRIKEETGPGILLDQINL